jgi:hypothetical protein
MPDDPDDLVDALGRTEDAFGGHTTGRPEYEDGLDPDAHDADVIQLRKACRLLDACRVLRDRDGYHTSVIEMSFAAIERTLEFYALTASNDSIDDFREGHDRAYDRAADLAVVSEETSRRLKQLYRDNRAAAYYRDTVAAADQAETMFDLAVTVHDHVTNFARVAHECWCRHCSR